jgi:cytochrome c biogenesis protein ResB
MIVSLHSHAFLFLSVLLVALLSMLGSLLRPHAHWAYTTTGWLQAAIFIWMPVYLLLTQKRVYRQGWFKTVIKYFFAGFWYAWMLFWALLIAAAISLSH